MLVDPLVIARLEGNLFDCFPNKVGNQQAILETIAHCPRFLPRDLDSQPDLFRIVGHDFRADAILQRRDDFSARSVIFRIRREHQHHIERQPHRIALNLHVAFLHDVEESDLNLAGQIRQFVNRKEAAIRSRQQAVVNRQLITEQVPALRGFDRIDVANDVGDSNVGSGEFLDKARVGCDPINVG